MSNRLEQFLALTPRAESIRLAVAERFRDRLPSEVAWACIDDLAENFAVIGVLFFQLRPSSTRSVRSIVANDCFAVVVILEQALRLAWTDSTPLPEQIACLDAIEELLWTAATKTEQRQYSVKRELIAAYFLAAALRNAQLGRPTLQDVRDDVFVRDELYAAVRTRTSLRDIVEEIRRRCSPPQLSA